MRLTNGDRLHYITSKGRLIFVDSYYFEEYKSILIFKKKRMSFGSLKQLTRRKTFK